VPSGILAYRPASVAARLAPRSLACPVSLRDLLRGAGAIRLALPMVRAPVGPVARGAIVAAREAGSALVLLLPAGSAPEPWVREVTAAADELAGGLPIALGGEVLLPGATEADAERALEETWRLIEAGVTHLALDVSAAPADRRGALAAELGRAAHERELGVELLAGPAGERGAPPGTLGADVEAMSARGVPPDAVGVRGGEAPRAAEVRSEVRWLAEVCAALGGLPVFRRGPVGPDLLRVLAASPIRGCEDGGAAERAVRAAVPGDLLAGAAEGPSRSTPLERAVAALGAGAAERLEARAYVEVADLVERLGASGSGAAIATALVAEMERA
jgi:hypothetical protein